MTETKQHYHYALGRRKAATATARLVQGAGEITINSQLISQYFNNLSLVNLVEQPLVLTGQAKKLGISLKVSGGGKRGQADAAQLALARALQLMSEDLRSTLRKAGYLTRDPREKERKKPG